MDWGVVAFQVHDAFSVLNFSLKSTLKSAFFPRHFPKLQTSPAPSALFSLLDDPFGYLGWKTCLGVGLLGFFIGVTSFVYSFFQLSSLNNCLRLIRSEHNQFLALTDDLKTRNSSLTLENSVLSKTKSQTESSMNNLLEFIVHPHETQARLVALGSVYKEQINLLKEQNWSLQKKNETLMNSLNCAICVSHEPDRVLRPCGHMLCSSCYTEIRSKSDQCPFCRQHFTGSIQTFRPS